MAFAIPLLLCKTRTAFCRAGFIYKAQFYYLLTIC